MSRERLFKQFKLAPVSQLVSQRYFDMRGKTCVYLYLSFVQVVFNLGLLTIGMVILLSARRNKFVMLDIIKVK